MRDEVEKPIGGRRDTQVVAEVVERRRGDGRALCSAEQRSDLGSETTLLRSRVGPGCADDQLSAYAASGYGRD